MEASSEIIDELKASVTAKLKELDPDNTELGSSLIDYIIVMVINQKNKYEMKHNLALFLGKISDDFVNWLFEHLSKLKQSNHDSSIDLNIDKQKKRDSKSKNSNKELGKKGNKEDKNESKENDHKSSEMDSKKANVKSETNKRKIANKIDADEASKRIPKKKLKSAVVNLVNNEENQENDENENQKSRPALRKRAVSNNIIKSNSEKYPPNNKEQRSISEDEIDDSILKENKKSISYETVVTKPTLIDNNKEMQTKFFVTLDGVKNMFKVDDDLFLMDEELDPELMNEDLPNIDQLSMNKKEKFSVADIGSNKFERCRYWPSCMNGNKCDYHHPFIKCNMFPQCRFGDKCLYIHPICKYDSVCSRKDCPFFHTFTANIKRCQLMMNPNNNNVTCKYFPKCANPNCEFIHPKIVCHYGSACKTFNCSYVHPDHQNHIPHPSQFKWSSSNGRNDNNSNILTNKQRQRKQIEISSRPFGC
ncbi:nuclear polyadenosine RNA-binding 2 isoform X1 [Dermatophagoides farinae]|uniref:nuclear polyadenosine RNA-binding 2 isoform X1 n=1 Tax=Dermatophagoides farinae TaxID=6954 RepID=UPI003F62682C